MIKLLINNAQGFQEIIEIDESGDYYDKSAIVWDERVDGMLPHGFIAGGYEKVNGELFFNQSLLDLHNIQKLKNETPQSISMRQARLQLLSMNLLDTVNNAILTMSQAAQVEWEYATEVKRDNPLVTALQTQLNMSDYDMDLFFSNASTL